jgi:predicted ATPase
VIASLILSEPERLQVIEGELKSIFPTIKKVRAKQAGITEEETVYSLSDKGFPISRKRANPKPGYELIFDTLSAHSVPAYAMSEGTLLVLGLLTMLQEPSAPQVFLLDDIEQGLHPLAQRELMGTLKEFAKKQGRQIILTSHSPYIVDELEAKDVWVMAIDREGFSRAKRLSDHPDAKRLLSVLTTGEFVGAVGEDWVVGDAAPVEEVNA